MTRTRWPSPTPMHHGTRWDQGFPQHPAHHGTRWDQGFTSTQRTTEPAGEVVAHWVKCIGISEAWGQFHLSRARDPLFYTILNLHKK